MPWFRFIGEARVTIPFRNGKCVLNFANLGGEDCWAWVAYREGNYDSQIILLRAPNVMSLHTDLMTMGFEVPEGSPAEKIMRAAIKCGFAEDLPEEKRWREEIIRTRRPEERKPFTTERHQKGRF